LRRERPRRATPDAASVTEGAGASPSRLEAFAQRAEPLWIAALGIQFAVLGRLLVPAMLHLVGRGGRVETVEWLIYVSLLIGYVPLIWVFAVVLPGRLSPRTTSLCRWTIIAVSLVELAIYSITANWIFLAMAVVASVLTLAALGYAKSRQESRTGLGWTLVRVVPLVIAGAFGWMCAGGIVSWGDAMVWVSSSPRTLITLIAATALTLAALRASREERPEGQSWLRWWDYLAIVALVTFGFRTYPIVELYHWGFYIGPIEQLRQGGLLLWDTPSQYGFASMLIPTALPGSAWVSFWFYQSVIFAVTSILMYCAFRRLGSRWTNGLFAFAITFTTLFFRPRDQFIILPAQMTPSGGPVRFVWCFVLLAFIANSYFSPPGSFTRRRFAVGGTLIWLASILWSAEAAIYCSAIWFSAYAVFLAQQALTWRNGELRTIELWRRLTGRALMLPAVFAGVVVLVVLIYRVFAGTAPDLRGYLEYALLYSRGGFGALPVDPSGSVWYLLLLLFIISTTAAMFLSKDRRDPRLVVLAGLWGGAWSVGSYFAGRSHPVNALSLLPLLLYSVAIGFSLLSRDRGRRWQRLVVTALVPAFAVPIVLTLGHAGFPAAVTQRQLPLSRITEQVPVMEPVLYTLLVQSGARPTDSFVRIGDGRLMLPAWPAGSVPSVVVSERSWLPKPYEIIGSLSPERRQTYMDRDARSIPTSGWLIHSKHDTIRGYPELRAQIERTRREQRRFENDQWILSWMAIVPPRSGTVPTGSQMTSPLHPRTNRSGN
jgi:hypothetical protein